MQEDFLTVRELAERLRVPPSWVYDRVRCERDPLPHYKMGKYLRFRWSQVIAWVERCNRPGHSEAGASRPVMESAAKQ